MKKNIEVNNHIANKFLNKSLNKKLSKNFDKIFKEILLKINHKNSIYNIFNKKLNLNFKFNKLKRFKKYQNIVIIGMGGSILGSEAIYDFLKKKIRKKIFFFDNLSIENISSLKGIKKEKILFLVISKSGNTIETISNLLSLNILKKNKKNIIIITEKRESILYYIAKKFNLFFIEHRNYIGGRYSVLSEVGVVPSYLMGINILSLNKNLKEYTNGNKKMFLKDSVIKIANILKSKKMNNLIYLNYEKNLEKFLHWSQQLVAESLGKKKMGFLPVVSNNPKDHHSLLQLYLDGPRDKLFNIFSYKNNTGRKLNTKNINISLKFLNNKSIENIKITQKNALINVFKKKDIPFREFIIKKFNEETLGELFAYFILETIIVGKLIGINPFNQPSVEQVKIITKKLLK